MAQGDKESLLEDIAPLFDALRMMA